MRTKDLAKFVRARELHRLAKEDGVALRKPDPIIAKYRFCNVRRNDDRVTKWVHRRMLKPWADHPMLWFAMVVARLFNNEPTLGALLEGNPNCVVPFRPAEMRRRLHARSKAGHKNFNAAYIVSTNGHAMNKVDYLIDRVLTPLWKQHKMINAYITHATKLEDVHNLFTSYDGLGSFMAAQVLADLKYADPNKWADFYTFAASGPGSRRGLNRVMGFDTEAPWRESIWRDKLGTLREELNKELGWPIGLTAHDVQNCLCEFDKYERARLGTGEPKQLYRPHEEN